MSVILFKVAVTMAVTIAGIPVLRSSFQTLPEASFIVRVLALQVVIASALFGALYVIGGQEVPSDVPSYYLPAGRQVLAGQVPFKDFPVSYGPLFAYVAGALAYLWNSGKTFALFDILINAAALVAWHRSALYLTDQVTARRTSILYATSGHLAYQSMLGTNQVWISFGLAVSVWLLLRNRGLSSGIAQALTASSTKFLALLFWPVLWICAPQRTRWVAGAFALLLVYAAFALGGGDVLYPIRHEGDALSSGNLPYLLTPLLTSMGLTNARVFDGAALTTLSIAILWFFWISRPLPPERRPMLLFAGLVLVGSIFMLVSKKSFTAYAVFFMYPAIMVFLTRARRFWAPVCFLIAFNILLVIEPTLWFRFGGVGKALPDWIRQIGVIPATIFLASELTLIACYACLTVLSVAYLRGMGLPRRKISSIQTALPAPPAAKVV